MFVSACLFAAMAFTACTTEVIYVDSDGNPVEHVDLKEGEGLLSVAVSSTDVSTRDVRPVGSSAAANNVNVVKVYAFSATTDAGSYTFDEAVGVKDGANTNVSGGQGVITITVNNSDDKGEVVNPDNGVNIEEEETITLTGLDPAKYYKFVAVGYNDADGQVNPYGEPSLEAGTTSLAAFTTSTAKTGYGIEELFATQSANATKGDVKTQGTLTLTRQVAGMLAYFKNVPATINGTAVAAIRIYANKSFTKFTYPATTDFNGVAASAETSSPTNKHLLMEFMLGTSEGSISTGTDADGYYTFNTLSDGSVTNFGSSNSGKAPVAKGYEANMPTKLTLVENSIFGGRYLIPYDQHYAAQNGEGSTLTIELQDAGGTALRTLKVKTDQSMSGPATPYFYDIRCNNFYSIGQKLKTETTDPDPEGGTDPDEPIDLSSKSEIVVQINDAWKVLHDMDVEED